MAPGLPESLEELHHVMPRQAVQFATGAPYRGMSWRPRDFTVSECKFDVGRGGLRSRRVQVDTQENDDAPKAQEEVHADPTL